MYIAHDMTESNDTMTNCRRSGSSSSNNIVNLVVASTSEQKYVYDENSNKHHLTLFDLQPVPISNHYLNVFDELSHQCDAVLHSSNSPLPTIGINNFCSSYLMPTTTTTTNDYERRFQRSLHKLTIPTWYTETSPSSKVLTDSKQSILSTSTTPWKADYQESPRTPEIIHIRRPHSYRSCRSSLATSPSPSMHSWHPNHMIDGVNFSLLIPPSSSSSARRHNKYRKGIERVSTSSRWYQPTQFVANKPIEDQTGIKKVSTTTKENHYDTPKLYNQHENLISKSTCLVVNSDVEEMIVHERNNNMITNVKEQDNYITTNESQTMPLVKINEPFSQIELEELTDDDDNQLLSNKQIDSNELLERAANDLVQSVLADILLLQTLDDDDDQNSGVRELSEDENGLRELDENDMNDTDEFIVFATQSETSDIIPRSNLNKLYTFSKINEDNSSQNSPRSIIEKDLLATNAKTEQVFDQFFQTSPIYQTQCQKQYNQFDGIMCPSITHQSSNGVNEETARIGRLLLERTKIPLIENRSQTPTSVRSTSKNTRFALAEQDDYQRPTTDECDDGFHDKVRRDSAYSSNQERIHIQQTIYEPLSECYSGYSFVQSDFLTSVQSTTDEAYESEPTTMSSSIATTTHIHPDLEHEFEYPSPPPPVPDRRLKPAYLKASPPPTKPRLSKQANTDSMGYSIIEKTKPLPITTIQQFLSSTSNGSISPSTRTMSSRHYCGSIPVSNEETTRSSISSTPIKTNELKTKERRNSRTLSCLHPSTTDDYQKRNLINKSSSSLNKTKIKKQKLITNFDEATNGLAIRLPAPISNGHESSTKPNLHRTSTPLSTKRVNGMTKNRRTFYETSV